MAIPEPFLKDYNIIPDITREKPAIRENCFSKKVQFIFLV
jgi:hypothetical protein